jgi:glutamyl/glutaminyl-tRNA synthetase
MLLGWSPKNDQEILTKEELIKEFSLEKINSAPSIFDERKLLWMNGEYIRKMEDLELKARILEFDSELKNFDQDLVEKFVKPAKTRMKLLKDFRDMVEPFLSSKTVSSEIKNSLFKALSELESWKNDSIIDEIKKVLESENLKFPDIYEAVIGTRQGLPLGEAFEILGKEKTLSLLK